MKEVDVELRNTVKEDDHQKFIMPRFINTMKMQKHTSNLDKKLVHK